MNLSFGSPEHGWIQIDVELNGSVIVHDVADTYNPFSQLIAALAQLYDGKKPDPLYWPNEPGCFTWEFSIVTGRIRFDIADPNGNRHFEKFDRIPFLNTFTAALKSLSTDSVWDTIDETHAWSYSFPYAELSELETLLSRDDA